MTVRSDLGLKCLQRLSVDDTSKQVNTRVDEKWRIGIYIKLQEHQIFACLRYFVINFVNSRSQVQAKMLGIIWIHTV